MTELAELLFKDTQARLSECLSSSDLLSMNTAAYLYGFSNIPFLVDAAVFRLGEHKGELKGAKEAYDALREGLQGAINVPANVPALPPSPTLDQILNAVKHVTDDVKATYAELKDTITKANELIDQLKGELDVLGRKLGYAVDGLTMLTFAGTGFLVGGPVGAAAGALAGAALSIFG